MSALSFLKRFNLRQAFQKYVVDALSAMALGVFASLIVGLILSQINQLLHWDVLGSITSVLSPSSPVIGAAIGTAIAHKLKASPFSLYCTTVAGAIGYQLAGALGAYFSAVIALEVGNFVSGKTRFDILLVPISTLFSAGLVIYLLAPPINAGIRALQDYLASATLLMPIPMGLIISTLFGLALTAPISSAALAAVVFSTGDVPMSEGLLLAAGAATTGCCCQMLGFAIASWRENGLPGFIVQGLGTSMVQFGNIMAKPLIWLPPTLSSALLGMLSTTLFAMKNASASAGMGTSGLVGQIGTLNVMAAEGVGIVLLKILAIQVLLPLLLTFGISELFRRLGWIKDGDMRIEMK